jgi:urease accessory protein
VTIHRILSIFLVMLLPNIAFAHPGAEGHMDFSEGLMHPLLGVDHLLALIAAGIWLAQQPHHNRPIIGGVFIGALGLSEVAGQYFPGIHVEYGVVATLVCLGALIATALKMPLLMSRVIFGFFAIIQGFIHSSATAGDGFGFGLMVSSTLILAISTALASPVQRLRIGIRARFVRARVMLVGVFSAV